MLDVKVDEQDLCLTVTELIVPMAISVACALSALPLDLH